MKAQHLAAYFRKRIARPIQYDVLIEQESGCVIFWAYELEVTAVDGDALYMMVTLKGVHGVEGRWLQRHNVTCGDIVIPLRDGNMAGLTC